jgi:hypothetical protein
MFVSASDSSTGTLLGIFSGTEVSDAQYAWSLAEMLRMDKHAADSGMAFSYVCVVDNQVPRPPAVWRKRFSDANYGVKSDRFYFVMVTSSMLIRGVYTAVNWVTPKRDGQHYGVVGSIAEAQEWLVANGASAADLAVLERQARRALVREQDAAGASWPGQR